MPASESPVPVPEGRIRDGIQEPLDFIVAKLREGLVSELNLYVAIGKAYAQGWRDGVADASPSPREDATPPEIREVFDYWATTTGKPRSKLTADRRSKVRARLKDGYSVEQLKSAVRGNHTGGYVDARGFKWNELTLICRSGANVERFMELDRGSGDIKSKVLG